jgi:hypothetical protein
MTSVTCARCGSMNMPTDHLCFKCGSPLQAASRIDSTQQPYFPPATHGMPSIWRTQSVLVMTKEALLPGRCVKCNAYTDERLKRKLTWHHPALYLLIFASILIYAIVAMIVRKTATVDVGFCPEHLAARKKHLSITWALGLLSIGSFVGGLMFEDATFFLASAALILATAIYGIVTLRVVVPTKIDDHLVWLKGVNADYLQELPEWRGARW